MSLAEQSLNPVNPALEAAAVQDLKANTHRQIGHVLAVAAGVGFVLGHVPGYPFAIAYFINKFAFEKPHRKEAQLEAKELRRNGDASRLTELLANANGKHSRRSISEARGVLKSYGAPFAKRVTGYF